MTYVDSFLLSYVVNSLWQVPLLWAAGWLAARALRPVGPAAEHRAWVAVLVLQASLPALAMLPMEWLRPLLFWTARPAPVPLEGNVSVIFGPGTALGGLRISPGFVAIAAAAYGIVTLYFIARFLWRCLQLASIRRNSADFSLSPSRQESWERAQQRFGVGNVSLRVTTGLHIPVTLGLRRSVILLPSSLAPALSDSDFRTVVEHECAHIRRHDFARNLLYELLSMPVSYHPALHLTRERIMETREMICDRLAAEHTSAAEYGRSLLRLASLLVVGQPGRRLHAIGIFDSNSLERRLMRLKENRNRIHSAARLLLVTATALLAVATCASALTLHINVLTPFPTTAAANSSHPPVIPAREAAEHVLSHTPPTYPPNAKKTRIQGIVVLKAIISKDGQVDRLSVDSGPKELQQSALDAVRHWTYKPFLLNGQPTEVETTINVHYSLVK